MSLSPGFPGYPSGWFALAMSDELKPGQLMARRFVGEDLVVYRTESGRAVALDAHCPHLGAHIPTSGRVEGEGVRCLFHGFCFDARGHCTETGYNTRPPKQARLKTWEVQEVNGAIFAWYSPTGERSTWQLPTVSFDGFTSPLLHHLENLRSHPQEVAENSVDTGHFLWNHGYRDVGQVHEITTDGHCLDAHGCFTRSADFLGRLSARINVGARARLHGLGMAIADVQDATFGLSLRFMVLATPVDPEHIDLRVVLRLKESLDVVRFGPVYRLLPTKLGLRALARLSFWAFKRDFSQDTRVWTQKRYLHQPVLAEGDGPIGPFRRWCRQFYPQAVQAPLEVAEPLR